jgi:hypothetical protein
MNTKEIEEKIRFKEYFLKKNKIDPNSEFYKKLHEEIRLLIIELRGPKLKRIETNIKTNNHE